MRSLNPYPSKWPLRLGLLACLVLASVVPAPAQDARLAAPPGPEAANRNRISDALSKGDVATAEKEIDALKAKQPAAPAPPAPPKNGSVFYEEIKACGFYPQETRLECVLDIKQKGGYGGPVGAFGSFEYVYFCVDWSGDGVFSAGEAVGLGIVQMHDEAGPANPPWQYAVYRDINPPGGLRTSNAGASAATTTTGPTRKARAILSWFTPPTSCNYSPVWGNIVDFTIRLDPIR